MTTPDASPARFRKRLVAWFDANARDLPWRRTRDPYAILVSEIMLQQTQVATVIGYFQRWMSRFPTVEALAAADQSDVLHAWQGLGYYSRARNLHAAARLMPNPFPTTPAALETLPGIGSYTAAAVATFAFDTPVPVLETNTTRVLSRLFDYTLPIDTAQGRAHLHARAATLLPATNAGRFNAALMELGALICLPRAPLCAACPVRPFCSTPDPARLPVKKPRPATISIEQSCAFIQRKNTLLLEHQTARRWRGLWCLPPLAAAAGEPIAELRFSITHHSVTLRVFKGPAPQRLAPNQRWVPLPELDSIPMPSPHRKAILRAAAHISSSDPSFAEFAQFRIK